MHNIRLVDKGHQAVDATLLLVLLLDDKDYLE